MTLSIGGVPIGGANPCRFVAEISNNHNGSLNRALRLIDAAKAAGAGFVKFQCYTPDELIQLRGDKVVPEPWGSQGWTMRTLYAKAQTPLEWFPALVQHCKDIGIPWFSSVFGKESLALLESLECPAYKIAALDHAAKRKAETVTPESIWLHDEVQETRKPIIQSVRGWDDQPQGHADLWLYCPPGYPQFYHKNLPLDLREIARFDGFSYHGTDPSIPFHAARPRVIREASFLRKQKVARASNLIEVHVQLDDEPSELEANVSLTVAQLRRIVRDVRATEAMLA